MLRGRRSLLPCLGVWVMMSAGCEKPAELVEVTGIVKMNGKGLAEVQVQFHPDPELGTKGSRSTAITDKDGRFKLLTDDQRPGAVVGHHRVLLVDVRSSGPEGGGEKDAPPPPSRIPLAYANVVKTPERIEIKPNQGPVEIHVKLP